TILVSDWSSDVCSSDLIVSAFHNARRFSTITPSNSAITTASDPKSCLYKTVTAARAAIPGAVTIAGRAIGKTAIAREGGDGLGGGPAGPGIAPGVCIIIRSAW